MQDTMGIILTEGGETLRELPGARSVAALPIGGRYRLIDFILSGMANSGITNVGVLPQQKYASLMEHLGAGTPWDLQREHGGLFVLPPCANSEKQRKGEIGALLGMLPYLKRSRQKYVVLTKSNVVCNLTFDAALRFHKKTQADITVLYHEGAEDASRFLVLETDGEGRALDMALCPKRSPSRKFGMEMYILERELLIALLESAEAQGGESFVMDILLRNRGNLRLYGWQYEGPIWHIDSVNAYFACNMDMLREEIQTALFRKEEKIYTKVKNRVPARYGGDADIRRCIVADGCILEGYAENCIFFRGAKLARRAHLQNCIVMEKTHIDVGARAENVIFDKECLLREGRSLAGGENYPLIIQKGAII